MDRRELFKKSGAAAAGLLLGSRGARVAYGKSGAEPTVYFGRFGNENLDEAGIMASYASPKILVPDSLRDQFLVFQLVPTENERFFVRSPQEIEPALETSPEYPDVVLDTRLLSFQLGSDEKVGEETRATVRITFGSDQNTDRSREMGENLYWAITSGLNLWNTRGIRAEPRDYRSDFRKVFGNKYVELPGGAGSLKVEIVKHRKSSWWEKAFNLADSNPGMALVSALGFPGVTSRVLHFVDEAANKFVGDNAKVLFASRGLPLAFSKQSKEEISSSGIRIGSLNSGIWIFARGRDLPLLSSQEMTYDATLRRLFPAKSNIADIISGTAKDPLRDVTYAILGSRLKHRKITNGF
ncbi:MAG: hypothetical protein OEM82_02405 [Acidobacteriota bacterium]|nr:hypothetical protein [Acidobacteriota bacterium]MDH3529153.1 hypothetical protein [Acidobacteriota bacterium]